MGENFSGVVSRVVSPEQNLQVARTIYVSSKGVSADDWATKPWWNSNKSLLNICGLTDFSKYNSPLKTANIHQMTRLNPVKLEELCEIGVPAVKYQGLYSVWGKLKEKKSNLS